MTTPLTLGQRIRDVRKSRQMTLSDVAGYSSFSIGYLSEVECDKKLPTLAALVLIAKALKTSVVGLLSGIKEYT